MQRKLKESNLCSKSLPTCFRDRLSPIDTLRCLRAQFPKGCLAGFEPTDLLLARPALYALERHAIKPTIFDWQGRQFFNEATEKYLAGAVGIEPTQIDLEDRCPSLRRRSHN